MPRLCCLAVLLLASCAPDGPLVIATVFDPCAPLVIAPDADTTAVERDGVARAVALWNDLARTQLTLDAVEGAPVIPVKFEPAPLAFYGLYEDEIGRVLVNRNLVDPDGRTITIAHELGHAFGMFHVSRDERSSVMNVPNLTIAPNPGDAATLAGLWGYCL